MGRRMGVRLRNQIAEWCLAALHDPIAEPALGALIAFCERSDESGTAREIPAEHVAILAAADCFERAGSGVRLRDRRAFDLAALRWRADRFSRALADCRASCGRSPRRGGDVAWSLCAAAALFNAELFFEVHELLEQCWRPAQGPLKTLLQGLIQVAVGLQHLANGNRRGALSLLSEGNAKLRPFVPETHGIELASFCPTIDDIVRTLSAGGAPSIPRLTVRQRSAIRR
jgi:hypothetical protein